jgi:hypothetical protein
MQRLHGGTLAIHCCNCHQGTTGKSDCGLGRMHTTPQCHIAPFLLALPAVAQATMLCLVTIKQIVSIIRKRISA